MISTGLNLIGLTLDFLGFCLLLREWWIAFLGQRRELELEYRRQQQADMDELRMRGATGDMLEHMQRSNQARNKHAFWLEQDATKKALKSRRRLFGLAAIMIVFGSLLQLISAVPAGWVGYLMGVVSGITSS